MITSAKNDLASLVEFLRELSQKAPQTTADEAIEAWQLMHAEADPDCIEAIREAHAELESGNFGRPAKEFIREYLAKFGVTPR